MALFKGQDHSEVHGEMFYLTIVGKRFYGSDKICNSSHNNLKGLYRKLNLFHIAAFRERCQGALQDKRDESEVPIFPAIGTLLFMLALYHPYRVTSFNSRAARRG